MKKVIKKVIISVVLVAIGLLINGVVDAATIDMGIVKNKSQIKPGDEVTLNISVQRNDDEIVMGVSGNLEYDSEILEPVMEAEGDNRVATETNGTWAFSVASVNENKIQFIVYATEQDKTYDSIMKLKFKVKDKAKSGKTEISLKEGALFDSQYQQKNEEPIELSTTVKVTTVAFRIFKYFIFFVFIAVVMLWAVLCLKKYAVKVEDKKKDNTEIVKAEIIEESEKKESKKADKKDK